MILVYQAKQYKQKPKTSQFYRHNDTDYRLSNEKSINDMIKNRDGEIDLHVGYVWTTERLFPYC